MKKKLSTLLLTLLVLISTMPFTSWAETSLSDDICILATSDVHCQVERGYDKSGACTNIGYPGVAAYRDAMKAQYNNVILVDNGDSIQGDLIGFFNKGESIVNIMNAVGYDIVVPGNHEFNYTADYFIDVVLKRLSAGTNVISCNLMHKEDSSWKQVLDSYYIAECGEKKVAFVGITTPSSLVSSNPDNFKNAAGETVYDFCNDNDGTTLYDKVQEAIDAAQAAGADYVIASGHLGDAGGSNYVWKSSDVIANTSGLTAFIDGHAHQEFIKDVEDEVGKKIPCIAVGTKLANIGKIMIDDESGTVSMDLIKPTDATEDSEAVQSLVNTQNALVNKKKEEYVGKTNVLLTINDANGERLVRKGETNLGDFVTDAYRKIADADVAIANGGAVRDNIQEGAVLFGDIFKVHPFGNTLCMCKATGQQILDALEFGAKLVGESENGCFLQVSGMSYKIDPTIESAVVTDATGAFVGYSNDNRKVYDVEVGGKPIEKNKTYKLASNNFIIKSGGDGMNMFVEDELILSEYMIDCEVLAEYLKSLPDKTVGYEYAEPQGRIVIAEKPEEDPVTPVKPDDKGGSEVDTGDNSSITTYILIMAVALAGVVILIILKRKK